MSSNISLVLRLISKNAIWLLTASILIGLIFPPLAEFMRPALAPAIFANITLALLQIDFAKIKSYFQHPILLVTFTIVVMFISPVLMWCTISSFDLPQELTIGLVLMAAAPPITSAPAFALIMRLEATFAVAIVLFTHALVPLSLPAMALWLLDIDLDVSITELIWRLAAIISLSFATASALKHWFFTKHFLATYASQFEGLGVISLIVFAIAIMAGVTDLVLAKPFDALMIILVAFIANSVMQCLGVIFFRSAGIVVAFTAGHMAGNRNMGLILAVLSDRASTELIMFFGLAQLPMFLLPVVAVPIYKRLASRHIGAQ